MQRIALGVEYDGYDYRGFQIQGELPTIQKALQTALSQVAGAPIQVYCAGRTDAGVHACGQVIHFDTPIVRENQAWLFGTNRYLPADIKVLWATPVPKTFHARFSALSREYCYLIHNVPMKSALFNRYSVHYSQPLDAERMHDASQSLCGEHDFSSFRAAACQSLSAWRYIHSVSVRRYQDYVVIQIKANAFLHHMVRNIVGALIEIGVGKRTPGWIITLLNKRDRKAAGTTAPSMGLYLTNIEYADAFNMMNRLNRPRKPYVLTIP